MMLYCRWPEASFISNKFWMCQWRL